MRKDLHGLTEDEAIIELDTFLWEFEESDEDECEIITGNGIVLKDLVLDTLNREGFNYKQVGSNTGAVIVYK